MSRALVSRSPWVFLAVAAASISAAPSAETPTSEGFSQSLFDGKTLAGWTVENDCEVAVTDEGILLKAGDGWLRSDRTYADFKLHVEWKALQAEKYDAGIFIRTAREGKPFPAPAYQINLLQGKEGNIGNLPGAMSTGLVKPGEWNVFDATVTGDSVALAINGKPAYKASGLKAASGYIGFQVEVPLGGQFLIRNVKITELGSKPLFNGRDLTGWEGGGDSADKCWEVKDGSLICTGKPGPWLRTAEEYGDFNLRFDYQVAAKGNSGVYVRVPKDGNHHRDNDTLPPAGFEVQVLDDAAAEYRTLKDYQFSASIYDIVGASPRVSKPAGEWNTLEINCKGQEVTISHNGVVVVKADPERYPLLKLRQEKGFLGLQNHSTRVAFRNVRIGPPLP